MATQLATRARPSCLPQPEAIRLEIFTTIPARCILHGATDNRTSPLICRNEIAVVESDGSSGWYPVDGGLFLIEYLSSPSTWTRCRPRRTCSIVQTRECRHPANIGKWVAAPYCSPTEADVLAGRRLSGPFQLVDGPYDFDQLTEKLIGKVIGIYSPKGLEVRP